MKKILYALMLVLGMSVLSSCSKEGNGTSIVGTWEYTDVSWYDGEEYAVYFQFKDNGTYVSVDISTVQMTSVRMSIMELGVCLKIPLYLMTWRNIRYLN